LAGGAASSADWQSAVEKIGDELSDADPTNEFLKTGNDLNPSPASLAARIDKLATQVANISALLVRLFGRT
jgi:hypothetical protein